MEDNSKKLGKVMIISAWLFLLIICFLFFKIHEVRNSGVYNTKSSNINGIIELQIPLSSGNRYEVFGSINGFNVKFLIDTGASSIAIPAKIAEKANLNRGMPVRSITAGGGNYSLPNQN